MSSDLHTRAEQLVDSVLVGITRDECESDDGWWENGTGADFGKKKRLEIIAAIEAALREQIEACAKVCRAMKRKDVFYDTACSDCAAAIEQLEEG